MQGATYTIVTTYSSNIPGDCQYSLSALERRLHPIIEDFERAMESNDIEKAREIVSKTEWIGKERNTFKNWGEFAIYIGAKCGNEKLVSDLLKVGVKPTADELCMAIHYNSIKMVEDLLNAGAPISNNLITAFTTAVTSDRLDILKFLVSKIKNKGKVDINAIIKAIENKKIEFIKLLTDGYTLTQEELDKFMNEAYANSYYEGLKYFLEIGANPNNIRNLNFIVGCNLDHGKARQSIIIQNIKLLYEYGLDISKCTDTRGFLCRIASYNDADLLRTILVNGNYKLDTLNLALIEAIGFGLFENVKVLMENIQPKDAFDFEAAFITAIYNNQAEIFKYLFECGAQITSRVVAKAFLDNQERNKYYHDQKTNILKYLDEILRTIPKQYPTN